MFSYLPQGVTYPQSFLVQEGEMAKYFCSSEYSNKYEGVWLFNEFVKH